MPYNKILHDASAALQEITQIKIVGHRASDAVVQHITTHLQHANTALIHISQGANKLPYLEALGKFEYNLSKIHKYTTNISPKILNLASLLELNTSLANQMTISQISHHLTAIVNFADYNDISLFQLNAIINPIVEQIVSLQQRNMPSVIPMIFHLIKLGSFIGNSFEGVLKQLISQLSIAKLGSLSKHEEQQLKLSYHAHPELFTSIIADKILSIPARHSGDDVISSPAQEVFFKEVKSIFKNAKSECFISEIGKHVDAFIPEHKLIIEFDGPAHAYKVARDISHRNSDFFYDKVAEKYQYKVLRVWYNDERSISKILEEKFPKLAKSLAKSTLTFTRAREALDFTNSDSSSEDDMETEVSVPAPSLIVTATTTPIETLSQPKAPQKNLKQAKASQEDLSVEKKLNDAVSAIIYGGGVTKQNIASVKSKLEEIENASLDLNIDPSLVLHFASKPYNALLPLFMKKTLGPIMNLKEIVPLLIKTTSYLNVLLEHKLLGTKCSISNFKSYFGSAVKNIKREEMHLGIEKLCYIKGDSWGDMMFLHEHNYPKTGIFKEILTYRSLGATPLVTYFVKQMKNRDLLNCLIKNGATIDAFMEGSRGAYYTALMALLIFSDMQDVEYEVKLLLEHGANTNYISEGLSMLSIALGKKQSPNIIKLLLEHGANPNNVASIKENSMFGLAIIRGYPIEVIKVFLDYDADLFYTDKSNTSILQYARLTKTPGIYDFLLRYAKNEVQCVKDKRDAKWEALTLYVAKASATKIEEEDDVEIVEVETAEAVALEVVTTEIEVKSLGESGPAYIVEQ